MNRLRRVVHQSTACLLAFFMINGPVWALDASDVAGVPTSATVTNAAGGVNVAVTGSRGIVEWSQMTINSGQTLQFTGAGGFSALNRVNSAILAQAGSTINGGGGNIYFVSPHSITLNGQVLNASKFVASGLNLSDTDFQAGNETFVPFNIEGAKQIGTVTNTGTINAYDTALLGSNVLNTGTISSAGGLVVLATGDQVVLGSEGSDIIVTLDANPVKQKYNVINDAAGRIENASGTIVLAAGDTFAQAIAHGPTTVKYKSDTFSVDQKGTLSAVKAELGAANEVATETASTTNVSYAMNIGARKVRLGDDLVSHGTMTINSDYGLTSTKGNIESQGPMDIQAQSVQVVGDIDSKDSSVKIDAETLYSKGDILSRDKLHLDVDETTLWGEGDQTIESRYGSVEINGTVTKIAQSDSDSRLQPGGDLYIHADQDVQLDGDVANLWLDEKYGYIKGANGGVSVIAENGMIHTGDSDALNIGIRAYSNDITNDIGVDLPYQNGDKITGKAAIVLLSGETLKLAPGCSLSAEGVYLSTDEGIYANSYPAAVTEKFDPYEEILLGVDDRPDINWLQADGEFIGGYERNEGVASDIAIYAGSKTGNVEVGTTEIRTSQAGMPVYFPKFEFSVPTGPATVVFDAYKKVTMPTIEEILDSRYSYPVSRESSDYYEPDNFSGFRLEAGSRVTEWLYQAIDNEMLPYADDPEALAEVLGEDYVLRGAGLDNPNITDGRAWVLENPQDVPTPVAPLADLVLPELKGCPVELDTAANELAMNTDDLQIMIGNAMATNPNIQPCEACQKLVVAADALRDRDGARIAAISQIFNTLAPIDAPFTPEITASVSTALAEMAQSDPQYALAADYINAFADYVAVINSEIKIPVGDPVLYTLNKYGETLMSNPNQNIVAYLIAQTQVESASSTVETEAETL